MVVRVRDKQMADTYSCSHVTLTLALAPAQP